MEVGHLKLDLIGKFAFVRWILIRFCEGSYYVLT